MNRFTPVFPAGLDTAVCAARLRRRSDELAQENARPPADAGLAETIGWVRTLSARAADALRRDLRALHPEIGWVGEDDPDLQGAGAVWLHDPIDGAYHFLQRLPLWSSSLALVVGGRPVLSMVYDPVLGELFSAEAGSGAVLNGERLAVSRKPRLEKAVLATAIGPAAQIGEAAQAQAVRLLGAVTARSFVVRQMASASLQLAYVAAGRLDGYWECGADPADWLAGAHLVEESGGRVSGLDGAPFSGGADGVLAAAPQLHPQLLGIIAAERRGDEPPRSPNG